MSRPFDDTNQWWREELTALAQIVHQGHTAQGGTWRSCPKSSCTRFRAVLEASHEGPEHFDVLPEDIIVVRIRRR